MTDYSKAAIEHALTALNAETEQEVKRIVQDGFTAFFSLNEELHRKSFRVRDKAGFPEMREELAAIVLYAAAIIYERDKCPSNLESQPSIDSNTTS